MTTPPGATLRNEDLVVRCGRPPFDLPSPLNERCDVHESYHGFSVQSAPGATLEDLAEWCPNNKIGETTVGALRELGYDVVITSGEGRHATVVVPKPWTSEDARVLISRFRELANPIPKERRLR